MILTKLGNHVNEMMAVTVKKFQNFSLSRFLIIKQNVNMATNSGLTPEATAVRRTMPPHCACRCYCLPFLRTSTLLSYPRRTSSDRATSFVSLRCATCIT